MTQLTLDLPELRRWAYAGVDRRCAALAKKRKAAKGLSESPRTHHWQMDIDGLIAEAVVAKFLGVHYAPAFHLDTEDGDVLPGLQVRSTAYPDGCLLIHPKDPDPDRYVLVTGGSGVYEIRGWIRGSEGKNDKWWRTYQGRSSFWVPQAALEQITDPSAFLEDLRG